MKRIVIFIFVLWAACFGLMAEDGAPAGTPEKTGQTGEAGTVKVNDSGSESESAKGKQADLEMPMGDTYSFFRSLMALSFVLGLIFLATYFFKKITGMKTGAAGRARGNRVPINQVGALPLGEKRFLSVVEIGGKHYFIGITPNSINMLSEIQLDPGDTAEPTEEEGREAGAAGSFSSVLFRAKELLNKGKK